MWRSDHSIDSKCYRTIRQAVLDFTLCADSTTDRSGSVGLWEGLFPTDHECDDSPRLLGPDRGVYLKDELIPRRQVNAQGKTFDMPWIGLANESPAVQSN